MSYFVITPIWDYDGCGGDIDEFKTKEEAENFINEKLPEINRNTGFSDVTFNGDHFTIICGYEVKTKTIETVIKIKLER